ncbi:hypothetical protein Q1695_010286 [Nippostrongylus brasiliensis]|nr:hypothetical protein Q1695_010286 [Nippostrongylus brasiliensis]
MEHSAHWEHAYRRLQFDEVVENKPTTKIIAKMTMVLCLTICAAITSYVQAFTCPMMLPPLGAEISMIGPIGEGTMITAICTNGQMMNGASSLTCFGGEWQPPMFGTCPLGFSNMHRLKKRTSETLGQGMGSDSQGMGFGMQSFGSGMPGMSPGGLPVSNAGGQNTGSLQPQALNTGGQSMGSGMPGMSFGSQLGSSIGGQSSGSSGVQCLAMLPPLGGTISFSSGSSTGMQPEGTVATAKCNDNSIIEGASTATCTNGQWHPLMFGVCGHGLCEI